MNRISKIALLITFCVYSFISKTHYCYYVDTSERFHGDCNHEIKEAAEKGELAATNFFPQHYECYDYFKDAKPNLSKPIIVKIGFDNIFIVPVTIQNTIPQFQILEWIIPEINCRSATLLYSNLLRGPPTC